LQNHFPLSISGLTQLSENLSAELYHSQTMINEMDINWLQGQQHKRANQHETVGDCRKSPKQTATITDDKTERAEGKAENAGTYAHCNRSPS